MLTSPAAPATPVGQSFPELAVSADDHYLGTDDDLTFNATYLSTAGVSEEMTITTPSGFDASVARAAGTKLGTALVGTLPLAGGGSIAGYTGSLLVMSSSAYAADSGAQACAPGTHTAVWELDVASVAKGSLIIPVAVDGKNGRYTLTMCFGAIESLGRQPEYVLLETNGLFRNPTKHGNYLFDATVTPAASDGTANPAADYELRAYLDLPETLSIDPTYDARTQTLQVTGVLQADDRPRSNVNVHVYGGSAPDATDWTQIGVAVTTKNGSYTFTKHTAKLRHPYVYAGVNTYHYPTCIGRSPQPGGCASYTIDGRGSSATKVLPALEPIEARQAPAELRKVLLTAAGLSNLPGAPSSGFVAEPIGKAGLTETIDPRSPCGAKITVPTLATGAIAFFVTTGHTALLQWANRLPPGVAATDFAAESHGTRLGCRDFTTDDGVGGQLASHLVNILSLPPSSGDDRLAVILRLTEGGHSVYQTKLIFQHGGFLMLTEMLTSTAPGRTFLDELAAASTQRFDTLPASS